MAKRIGSGRLVLNDPVPGTSQQQNRNVEDGDWTTCGRRRDTSNNRQKGREYRENWRSNDLERPHIITNPRQNRKFHVGFKILEGWTQKNSDEIIVEVMGQKTGFEDLLESKDLSGDTIVLVIKILSKMCLSAFSANKLYIMNLVSKDNFIVTLQKYIIGIQLQDASDRRLNTYFWKDIDSFFADLSVICASLIESVPTRACEMLPKTLKACIIAIEDLIVTKNVVVANTLKINFETLQNKLDLCKKELEQKKAQILIDNIDEQPPDNFRELDVYPSNQEILSVQPAFIRRNIVEGAYEDVDHYLDVQFRLLKEDFVAPLREGVGEYISCNFKDRNRMKFSNVRIHQHVEFLSPYFSRETAGILLQFDINKHIKKQTCKNYGYSRRFMFGALLCFTKDNFTTITFGKVIERKPELLERQQIVIELQPGEDGIAFNTPYVMVECNIYFEPYFHVLKALQNIFEDSFPMRKYLIEVNSIIEPPAYIINDNTLLNVNNYSITPLVSETWPNANELSLDETQYSAFKSALTQSFSIIQGPPGTGKTYLGLQIAKVLIANKKQWYAQAQAPILVVCFTNHALDQFLEGLIDTTEDIVRIGGQSKNKKLELFNIRNKRNTATHTNCNRAFYNVKAELQTSLWHIKTWTNIINDIEKYDGVLSFKSFASIQPNFSSTWFASASSESILAWLLGGRTFQQKKMEERLIDLDKLMEVHIGTDTAANNVVNFEEQFEVEHENSVIDDSIEFLQPILVSSFRCLTTLGHMWKDMEAITHELENLPNDVDDVTVFNKKWELENALDQLQDNWKYLKMRLDEGKDYMLRNKMGGRKPMNLNLHKPHNMSPNDRWHLYFYWLSQYKNYVVTELAAFHDEYKDMYQQYIELKHIDDIQVMKQMLVVGMTTTSAARLQTALQTLKCPIVIVEEAAEVLESHIVVSLTNSCQQLILIGDHKQLRPSTATYKLEKDFNLGISLFERMVRNNIQCNVLGVQHRMRPEFAKLIVPAIYPSLQNHISVEDFPPVLGVSSNLYFITHNVPEHEAGDSSKENKHEASFLIALARYLIQNGYKPEDITILAAYSAQMFTLWHLRNEHQLLLKDVRITVLDNYQGEESKIILLSLVRNNQENKIGFLKNENRVCVALSRAREGFYIIGNIDILCRNSEIWPKVQTVLIEQQALGTSLPLQCQLHPDMITRVESGIDFNKVPEGGCSKICGEVLHCGHNCVRICHIADRVHEKTMCKVKCEKILCKENHKCQKMCYEDCGECQVLIKHTLMCGHEHGVPCYMDPAKYKCHTPVACKLPCNHEVQDKPCFQDVTVYKCPYPCETRVEPCGHSCVHRCHMQDDPDHIRYKCYKPCGNTRPGCSIGTHMCPKTCHEECLPCDIVIKKQRSVCDHVFDVKCNSNVDEEECVRPCRKTLPCGHKCKKMCYENCGDCPKIVLKTLPLCNHKVKTQCSREPEVRMCNGKCPKILRCGHPCNKKCKEDCTSDDCNVLVDHKKPVACGHTFKIPCYMVYQETKSTDFELLQYCQEPCRSVLLCEHVCSGTCGECGQGRIHQTCTEKCGVPLVCGHECSIPCRQTCQPCTKPCEIKCIHSTCKKTCGDPCTKCKEKCRRQCPHRSCKSSCGDICNVEPCTEPCSKELECGHKCVGFCGDPCPPLCRVCNNDELCEIFFGTEDDEDARFVLLLECKHVVESEGMEQWLNQASNQIGYKQCPKCKTTLCNTGRYSDYIKRAREDVIHIKRKFFGCSSANEQERIKLLQQLWNLLGSCRELKAVHTVIEDLIKSIKPIKGGKRQGINMLLTATFTAKIQIIESIIKIFNRAKLVKSNSIKNMLQLISLILKHLLPPHQRITNQEISDFNRELNRLVCLAEISQIEERLTRYRLEDTAPITEIKNLLFDIHIFDDDYNNIVKEKIKKYYVTSKLVLQLERKEIICAMGMSVGHWYKCPNGHFYYIAHCGGANQVGRCIECKEKVGGSGHMLLSRNERAREMEN